MIENSGNLTSLCLPFEGCGLRYNPSVTYPFTKGLMNVEISGAGSGNRTRTLSLEGSYDTISPYPLTEAG